MRVRLLALLFLGLAVLLPTSAALGEIVIFKDLFIVEGKVKRDMSSIIDPVSGKPIPIPLPGGFYSVEDGARVIIFSPSQVREVVKSPDRKNQEVYRQEGPGRSEPLANPFLLEGVSDWGPGFKRTVTVKTPKGSFDLNQVMTSITPEFIRVQTYKADWKAYYLTDEINPKVLGQLLYKHLEKKIDSPLERTMKVYRFYLQAGWTDAAQSLLTRAMKDYAGSSALPEVMANLKKFQAEQFVKGLERAAQVGQHDVVRAGLKRYDEEKFNVRVEEKSQFKVQELKIKYRDTAVMIEESRRLLKTFAPKVPKAHKVFFKQAATIIDEELNDDTVGRLEVFLGQARAFELAYKQGVQPTQSTEELLSFAVSGWVVGNGAAEENVDAARDLWFARNVLIEYLKTESGVDRKDLLSKLDQRKIRGDLLARALPLLPPAEPFEKLDGKQPFKVDAAGNLGKGGSYHVQLPPDYQHVGRTYPVLLVLHSSGEKPHESLKRWKTLAAQYGYILAAPAWGNGIAYKYSEGEHAAVLDCLRDLRRRFAVNSDRVFLFGCGEGGKVAYDVGLAHPDQFAGVMPMSTTPQYFPLRYWSNAYHLPFYVINGERSGQAAKENKLIFKEWVRGNYPVLYVEYKGRSLEWFEAEPKFLMDWMNGKRRLHPFRQLGIANEEYKTMRQGDNRFYWLSAAKVMPQNLNQPGNAFNRATQPATLRGSINANNDIFVHTTGVAGVTVWLGPGMVNTSEVLNEKKGKDGKGKNARPDEAKVKVHFNNGPAINRTIVPSPEVLLEGVYQSGDRQRLYWARIDL